MRTTLNVDDDVLAGARALAAERGISVGAALSELARHSLRPLPVAMRRSVPGFRVDPDGPPITPEMVRAANEDSWTPWPDDVDLVRQCARTCDRLDGYRGAWSRKRNEVSS